MTHRRLPAALLSVPCLLGLLCVTMSARAAGPADAVRPAVTERQAAPAASVSASPVSAPTSRAPTSSAPTSRAPTSSTPTSRTPAVRAAAASPIAGHSTTTPRPSDDRRTSETTSPASGVITLRSGRWADVRSVGQITVRSEFPLDVRSASALNQLGPTQRDIETRLGLTIPEKPIEIHLFRNRRTFDEYIRQRVPAGVGRTALFVQSHDAGRVYAYYSDHMHVDVRHESTHALLHSALPYVPLWLDEGLGEYFEMAPRDRFAGHPSLRSLKRKRWMRWRPNLTRLESLSELRDMGADEYSESWGWVHWMLHGPEPVQRVLREYLDEIARGGYPGAIEPRLRRVVRDPSAAMRAHLWAVR